MKEEVDRGLEVVAQRVRGRGGRGRLDDVRRAAAGGRDARARARGERVRRGSCAGWSAATELVVEKVGLAALAAFVLTTVMLGILGALLGARLRARAAVGRSCWRSARSAFGAHGRRDRRRSRARSARPRWPPSWSRCRWRRSRSCPPARSPTGIYDLIRVDLAPSSRSARRCTRSTRPSATRRAARPAPAPRRADARLRRARAPCRCAASPSRRYHRAMAFPATRLRRLRATTGHPRPRARDRARGAPPRVPDVRRRTAAAAATPIASMPGVDHLSIDAAVREAGEVHALGHPGGAAVRARRRPRTRRARARGTTRASSSSRRARSRPPIPTCS